MKLKTMVFGASGGIGESLKPALEEKYECIFLDSKSGNIRDTDRLRSLSKKHDPDIVIDLVGTTKNTTLINQDLHREGISNYLDLNLTSHIMIVNAFLPNMVNKKFGRFIFTSSIVAERPVKGAGLYAIAKRGIEALTEQIALEYGSKGITSNCLQLGYFDKGMIKEVPEEILETIKLNIPNRTLGTCENISNMINTIVDSPYLNGSVIKIAGGL